MPKRQKISAVLIVKNVAGVLPDCLASLEWVDEIIVLDAESHDETVSIAQRFGAKVFYAEKWAGFGKQRQQAQAYASHKMIFMIDADERVTPELRESIENILQSPKACNQVYSVNRKNFFLERFMHYSGWSPDWVVRLYPSCYHYNDNIVHESLYCQGEKIKKLAGDLEHLTCTDIMTFKRKQFAYAQAWAEEKVQQGKKSSLTGAFLRSVLTFFRTLIIKRGFLDGNLGWYLACIYAQYTFNKYALLWVLHRKKIRSL